MAVIEIELSQDQVEILNHFNLDPKALVNSKLKRLARIKREANPYALSEAERKRKKSAMNAHKEGVLKRRIEFLELHIKTLRADEWSSLDDLESRYIRLEVTIITRVLKFYEAVHKYAYGFNAMQQALEASQAYAESSRQALEQLTLEHQELLEMLQEGVKALTPAERKRARVRSFERQASKKVRSITGTTRRLDDVDRMARNVEKYLSRLPDEALSKGAIKEAMGLEQSIADVWAHLEQSGIIEVERKRKHIVRLTDAA